MTCYHGNLNKLFAFLGRRADESMGEITKEDVVAFRDALIRHVSAKTDESVIDFLLLSSLFPAMHRADISTF